MDGDTLSIEGRMGVREPIAMVLEVDWKLSRGGERQRVMYSVCSQD